MDIEIKPWVKPHLRARLIEEAKAKEPKTAQGVTPITASSAPAPVASAVTLVNGDTVRVVKPANVHEAPGWNEEADGMDACDNQWVVVVWGTGCDTNNPDQFTGKAADGHIWWFSTNWVVEQR